MDCRGGVGDNGRCIVSYSRSAFSLPYSSISLTEESSHRKQYQINRYLQYVLNLFHD